MLFDLWRGSRGNRRLLVSAVCMVALTRIALWVVPFRVIAGMVQRLTRSEPSRSDGGLYARRVGWAVEVTSRCIPAATCLTQALAAAFLLGLRGFAVRLHIGVARDSNQQFAAHAWLESNGTPVVGFRGAESFSRLTVIE